MQKLWAIFQSVNEKSRKISVNLIQGEFLAKKGPRPRRGQFDREERRRKNSHQFTENSWEFCNHILSMEQKR